MAHKPLKIYINGAFKVLAANGVDITPKGSKEKALLALLASAQHGTRSRSWIKGLLWSTRGQEQAGGSLRQATVKVRRSLGDAADVLSTTRLDICLNLDFVEIIADPSREFLEGMDVKDDEFIAWLHAERLVRSDVDIAAKGLINLTHARPISLAPPVCIQLRLEQQDSPDHAWLEKSIADTVTKSLSENFSLPVVINPPEATGPENWIASVSVFVPEGEETGVRIALSDGNNTQQLWSEQCVVKGRSLQLADHPDIRRLCYQFGEGLADALVSNFGGRERLLHPDLMCQLAIRRMFSLRAGKIAEADALFAQAYKLHKTAVYLAWRAQLRAIQYQERIRTDLKALAQECEGFAAKALELDPNNSMVLALIANARIFGNRTANANLKLALRAANLNPGNPMAWLAISSAQMELGQHQTARDTATVAAKLLRNSHLDFWANSQLASAFIALGQLDDAKQLLMSVALDRPNFHPALRNLFMLHAKDQEWDSAMDLVTRLSALEPGFSVQQLLKDSTYPIQLLREMGGLDASAILEATTSAPVSEAVSLLKARECPPAS